MDLQLEGKVAVVTGAGKGIGMATTQALTDEGAFVVAGSLNIATLTDMEKVTAVAVDLAQPEGPGLLVAKAIETHGRLDVLVNNVGGVKMRLDGFLNVTDEDFMWSLQMNFFAAFARN